MALPVATIISFPSIILGRAGSDFTALGDLHGKTVGVMRGGRFDDSFDADPFIKKETTNNYEQTMRMVMARRLDAAIGSNVGLYFNAKRAGIRPEELGKPLILGEKPFVLLFSRKNADEATITALREAIQRLQAKGEIRRIVNKYVDGFPWEIPGKAGKSVSQNGKR